MQKKSLKSNNGVLFASIFAFLMLFISFFNFIVDPYFVFRDNTIFGFNNVKIHKYTNKRTIIYSDMKLNMKDKDTVFTGNCLLSHYQSGLENVGFFTLPVAKISEVSELIKHIISQNKKVKTIYWGMFFDDFCNDKNPEVIDVLPQNVSKNVDINDLSNLFFSYNTTKYSTQTVLTSIKNKGQDITYIYPYREIAYKNYNNIDISDSTIKKIKDVIDYANNHGVKIVVYYSPIHISKKLHVYSKGEWNNYIDLKRKLASITDYYDYSYANKYNTTTLDENNDYFIDNFHPATEYNNLVVYDLLATDKKIGKLITKNNVEKFISEDTKDIKIFINKNKKLYNKISHLSDADFSLKFKKNFKYKN